MHECDQRHDDTDEKQMARLNPDAEEQQRRGNMSPANRFVEPASKTQAVHQFEHEGPG